MMSNHKWELNMTAYPLYVEKSELIVLNLFLPIYYYFFKFIFIPIRSEL